MTTPLYTRTRVTVDLVISHLPSKIGPNARRLILNAIAGAAGGLLGEIEPGARVEVEGIEGVPTAREELQP